MLPNLVPPSRDLGEDPMSSQLREQFRAFQHLHGQHHRQHHRQDASINNHHVQTDQHRHRHQRQRLGTAEDTDDETLSEDMHASLSSLESSSSHDHHSQILEENPAALHLAMSTAIAAQNEIDALMNGISELERVISSRTLTSDSVNSDAKHHIDIGASSRHQGVDHDHDHGHAHRSSSSEHLPVLPVED